MLNPIIVAADKPSRLPPHNLEAEQALLGAILANNRAYERVAEYLRAEHFAEPLHGRIFETCGLLIGRGQLASTITMKTVLAGDSDLMRFGGESYLERLVGAAATIINAGDYGRLIHDLHLRRELIAMGEEMVNDAFDPEPDMGGPQQIEIAEAKLFELATTGRAEGGFISFNASMKRAIDQAEAAHKREGKLSGVTTGFARLNDKLGGLHHSDLLIMAGRPSMGKTALATNIAVNAARAHRYEPGPDGQMKTVDGAMVAFFSLEMSADQLATRVLAEVAEVPSHLVREGKMSHDQFAQLVEAAQELHRLPLYIDDTPALSVSAIRARSRRLHRTHAAEGGLGLIVVDYLQLITGSPNRRAENRVQEVSEVTRSLKALAKELNVPVLALSQLSRAPEQREDHRPQLSDLRESGSIEQDADVVMFIFREQYYLERQGEPVRRDNEQEDKHQERCNQYVEQMERAHNKAEVNIAKQRHGPVGTVKLMFNGELTKFGDLDEQHDDPPPF